MLVTCERCGWQGENARYCSRCGADLASSSPVAPRVFPPPPITPASPAPVFTPVATALRPAGFWIRFVAVMIDGVVLIVAQGLLFSVGWMLSGGSMNNGLAVKTAVNFFGTLIGAAYGIFFHWLWGQTIGKMALQIKVVSMDGGPLSFGQAVGRYFATFLSALILCIGFIMAGIRSDKRAFHEDMFERREGGWHIASGYRQHAGELLERAERARRILHERPFDPPDPPLATALVSAALLFHAHLYFEVHELLEPYWLRAEGGDREALQGLIQVAVGFAHLANGNVSGARSLLHDGCARVLERTLEGVPLDPFGRALQRSLDRLLTLGDDAPRGFDWNEVPRFPVKTIDD